MKPEPKVANSAVHARTVFFNEPKCKQNYGVSLFHTSTTERPIMTHTVKITRPAGPVPIYYGMYAIPVSYTHLTLPTILLV